MSRKWGQATFRGRKVACPHFRLAHSGQPPGHADVNVLRAVSLGVWLSLLLAASCAAPSGKCSPDTCSGCCDGAGQCVSGSSDLACGKDGFFCSACGPSQSCGAGACAPKNDGTCQPLTCAGLRATCGQAPDGCGGVLSCGTCPTGQSCGGGGVPNSCGTGTCTPSTCAAQGKACGPASDGCGGVLDCGGCPSGKTCGGGGVANVCGDPSSCTPTTCMLSGKTCGSISDGCGKTLDCGSCSGGLSCGGGGVPNVCGDACGGGCPAGYTCQGAVCKGGNSENLTLDVHAPAVISVGGVIRYNGAGPQVRTATSQCGLLKLTSVDGKYSTALRVDCNNASNVTFAGRVVAGTYRAELTDAYDRLVVPEMLAPLANVDLRSSRLDLVLDFSGPVAVSFSGKVLKNGAAPVVRQDSSYCGWATFESPAFTRPLRVFFTCSMSGGVTFQGWAIAGTYKVSAFGGLTYTDLPGSSQLVLPALAMTPGMAPLVLNMTGGARIELGGSLRINSLAGAQYGPFNKMSLEFKNTASGETVVAAPQQGVSAFSTALLAGNYDVTLKLTLDYGRTPLTRKLLSAQPYTASNPAVVLDTTQAVTRVAATLTVNGSPVTPGFFDHCFGLLLTNTANTDSYDIYCPSSLSEGAFAVPPGTYKAEVFKVVENDPLPEGYWPAGTVTVGTTALTLNLAATTPNATQASLSAVIRHNGLPPVVFNGGSSSCGVVKFEPVAGGEALNAPFACSSSAGFSIAPKLLVGTYKVSVQGDQLSSSLPNTAKLVMPALVVSASTPAQVFNVATVPIAKVAGRVLHNGVAPLVLQTTGACGEVTFTNANGVDHQKLPLQCASGSQPTFQGIVLTGTYKVSVRADSDEVLLPSNDVVAIEQLAIP